MSSRITRSTASANQADASTNTASASNVGPAGSSKTASSRNTVVSVNPSVPRDLSAYLERFIASIPTSEEIGENLRQKLKELVDVTTDDAKYRGTIAADMFLVDGIKIIGHQEWSKIFTDNVKQFEDSLRCQAHSELNLPLETSSQLRAHIEAVQAFTKAHNERLKGKTSAH